LSRPAHRSRQNDHPRVDREGGRAGRKLCARRDRGPSSNWTENRGKPGPSSRCLLTDTSRAMASAIIFIGEAPAGVMRRHFYGQSSRDPQGILASS
jgi:hypothetical protein